MAAPTPVWSLPLLDGSEAGVFKTLYNALANALESALNSFKAKTGWGFLGPYTSLASLNAVTGDHAGQKATVAGSATASENGDYTWGGTTWTKDGINHIINQTLFGGTPPAGAKFIEQTGIVSVTTSSSGFASVTFGSAFPNGLAAVNLQRYDQSVGQTTHVLNTTQSASFASVAVYQTNGSSLVNTTLKFHYWALGW